jgi:hypothetical protein
VSFLPDADRAIVEERKVTGYLLAQYHPTGQSKARFFSVCGYSSEAWLNLAAALVQHARVNEIAREQETQFGTKYVIDGPFIALDGAQHNVRSVWFIEHGEQRPRLVTAYPRSRR